MRKNKFFTAVIVLICASTMGILTAKAQDGADRGTRTTDVKLNIKLYPYLSISIDKPEIDFVYETTADYETGKDGKNTVTVFSTGAFEVTVNSKSGSTDLTNTTSTEKKIPLSTISLKVDKIENITGAKGEEYAGLQEGDMKILGNNTVGTAFGTFDVNYHTAGGYNYLQYYSKVGLQEDAPIVYSADLTYTIVAK